MIITFRYRLLPTKRQHRALEAILESQRHLYNAALEERIDAYRKAGITPTYFDQTVGLSEWRRVDPHNTTQDCSGCGSRVAKRISDRRHECPGCGLSIDRDLNAARNILNRAGVSPGLHNAADLGCVQAETSA
jgi:transposase